MIVIVCTEDRGGMLFNNRRVSKDRTVIQRSWSCQKERSSGYIRFLKNFLSRNIRKTVAWMKIFWKK